jgi:peptidase M28-like protein
VATLRDLEGTLAEKVSGPHLMDHVRELARWRRHAGTPGERDAVEYLRRVMAGYGYTTRVLWHDAYISLPVSSRLEWAGRVVPSITHSFGRSSPPGGVEADVVDAGTGRPADFDGLDVRGKIALIAGVASPGVAREANLHGAVGQIHISPHEYLHEMCVSPVWGSPADDELDSLPKTVIVSIPFADGQALKAALAQGPQRVRQFSDVDTAWRQTPILQADLPGGDPKTWLMFSGHFCSWYEGAMDNGGANATMLEVARLCAQHRDRWERGLRVLFWSGHSQGRYSSSAWYADAVWEEIDDGCVGHINVDSTGGHGNTVVADTTAMPETGALARAILREYAGQEWSGRRMRRAGDQSFWGLGVSCLFANMSEQPAVPDEVNASAAVFGGEARRGAGTGWWWHTPYDTVDKIDEAILVRDTRIYLGAVWRYLTDPILPLDFSATARTIRETLTELQAATGSRFDLAICVQRASEVEKLAVRLNHASEVVQRAEKAHQARTANGISAVNACLVGLQRALVPVMYAGRGRFDHDPALDLPALPVLDAARLLPKIPPDGAQAKHLEVRMRRARTRVAVHLREAVRHLEKCLGAIETP